MTSASGGTAAGVVNRIGAVAAHQPRQSIDVAHLGPRQRMLEHRSRICAEMGAVSGCFALQRIQIPHRIGRHLIWEGICQVGQREAAAATVVVAAASLTR